jgi:hypothetical protein
VDDWLVCIAMLMSIAETVISFFCMSDMAWQGGLAPVYVS